MKMSEILKEEMTAQTQNAAEDLTADVQQNCTLDKDADGGEELFTRERVERLIRERLRRERRTAEDLTDVKKLLKSVSEKGVISGNSYAEMAQSLVEKLTCHIEPDNEVCEEDERLQEKSDNTSAAAYVDGEMHATDCGQKGNDGDDDSESFIKTLTQIKAKYPTADTLLSGDRFQKFAKGRSGSISEIFDDYYDFVTTFSDTAHGDGEGHAQLASTAFSAKSGVTDTGESLTKQQMEIAKSAGMSYREYANLLKSIPQRAARTL